MIGVDASMAFLGVAGGNPASGAPSAYHPDSTFPFDDTWYGEPLASHLLGHDPDADPLDVGIRSDASWDGSNEPWYDGAGDATRSGSCARVCWQNNLGGAGRPPLFAPTPSDPDSSHSHLDETAFPVGWDRMTPRLGPGAPALPVDAIARGLLTDLGRRVRFDGVDVDPAAADGGDGEPHTPSAGVAQALSAAAAGGHPELVPRDRRAPGREPRGRAAGDAPGLAGGRRLR